MPGTINRRLVACQPLFCSGGITKILVAGDVMLKENLARIRHERGLSQKKLADLIGVRQNTIAQIESGTTRKTKYLPEIAKALKVNIYELDPSVTEEKPRQSFVFRESELQGSNDLPLYGSVEAGEGLLVVSNEPVDSITRPAPLAQVRRGYGVIVTGESMVPLLRPGDTVLVHPHLPPRREDLCVFRQENNGEFRATIKEFCGQSAETWRVKRYQPEEKEFSLKKADWPECHVIIGKYNRR